MTKTVLLLAIIVFSACANAQSFDAASIRPNQSEGGMSSIRASAGLLTIENASLKKILMTAYAIPEDQDYRFAGPEWLATEHFDIQARFPANTTMPEVQQMMQALLADRFKLTLHRETRQLATYALIVGKNGPKIHAVDAGQPSSSSRPGRLQATKIPLKKLGDLLSQSLGQPVIDATGLTGVFDIDLQWSQDTANTNDAAADGGNGPSIFTAIQEQLGLKLEPRKGPVEVLVIDQAEKAPTEN
jgi:uncharacterized protein (TIGR03435 family)